MIQEVLMRDNQSISVCVVGAGEQKVFLVHGVGGSHYAWLPFAIPFLKDFTFIIPNLRGFGLSSETPYIGENVVENYANDIEDMVDHFVGEDEKFILCSLSMGALSSLCFLSREKNRARVAKYLNVDQSPMAKNNDEWKYGLFGLNQDELLDRTQALVNECVHMHHLDYKQTPKVFRKDYIGTLGYFFSNAFHRKIEKYFIKFAMTLNIAPVHHMFSVSKFKSYLHCINTFKQFDHDFRSYLQHFCFPVTVFAGTQSDMYPVAGQMYMSNNIPNSKFVEFNESHALMYTAPVKFTKEFKKFLYND
jgi:pimeloyl-ACP methyl ester carboxylesterase